MSARKPVGVSGVITINMMISTNSTSIIGVTLISALPLAFDIAMAYSTLETGSKFRPPLRPAPALITLGRPFFTILTARLLAPLFPAAHRRVVTAGEVPAKGAGSLSADRRVGPWHHKPQYRAA